MSVKEEVELLRRVPLFLGIEPARLKLLAFTSSVVAFENGDELFRQGEMGDCAFVVLEGSASALIDTPQGELTVARFAQGDLLGEIAILCDLPRTATVRAEDALKVLRISREPFFELLHQFPDMAVQIARLMAERLANTTAQLAETKPEAVQA
jgi:CRP-like cAMP-binding protein